MNRIPKAAAWFALLGAVVCLASGVWFAYKLPALRAVIRPIYIKRGIIPVPQPEVDAGPTPTAG